MLRPLPSRVSGIVFDCDGLLVDTEVRWRIAESTVFANYGHPYGDAESRQLLGLAPDRAAHLMAQLFGVPEQAEAVHAELLAGAERALRAQSDPQPGALEFVRRCVAAVPVAIASNTPRSLLDLVLERSGMAALVQISVSADEVDQPKPAPDPYLRACELIGATPRTALAFEDSPTGVASAKAARLGTVGVPSSDDPLAGADWHFARLDDPRLLAWADGLTLAG